MNKDAQTPNIIVGTAGHVDHGKTALVERLTGINADRFAEEQERGLTIDLGFAWFKLPSGAWAGIVDVPGHERFVKNMLAGATGIDVFMLVVAADEGIMPQTREHLTILNVLNVNCGIVVITKCDLVDAELLELVTEEIKDELAGTVFETAPVAKVSARTGEGINELISLLDETAKQARPRDVTGPVRMQVDRSFSMKGFGTVVTGSLIRGRLRVDDELEILPGGTRVRVRNLEVYGEHVQEVAAPCRVGVNLAGVGKDELERGDQIVAPGSMAVSYMLDVRVRVAADAKRPLIYRERVRIHHGAAEVLGRVVLLEGEALEPGEEGLAQLRLEEPLAATVDDHFVIRRYSPAYAIGGGIVLDPQPARHRRRESDALDRLRRLETGASTERASDWFHRQGLKPVGVAELAAGLQVDVSEAEELLEILLEQEEVITLAAGRYLDKTQAESFLNTLKNTFAKYHTEFPLKIAMPMSRLQTALNNPPAETLQWALRQLKEQGIVLAQTGGWRLSEHEAKPSEAQLKALNDLNDKTRSAGLSALSREQALEILKPAGEAAALLELALEQGAILAVAEFIFWREALAQGAQALHEYYQNQGAFAISEARDLLGTSRKYVVPILEYFDGTGFTRREGDRRFITRVPGPREGFVEI